MKDLMVYCVFHFRWIFVCLFLLPCTVSYDLYIFGLSVLNSFSKKQTRNHVLKLQAVQKQVRQWQEGSQEVPMCTGRPGWKAMTVRDPLYKRTMHNIHMDLGEILEIDLDNQIIKVEPLVTMGQLTATLVPLGWTLPLVAELDDLTVGGLIMGGGIESSSHAVGLFQHNCVAYELVLSDGSVARCSKEENPDLFYAVPWSYGTLGFLTTAELKIIPAKRYVRLKYEPVFSLDDAARLCEIYSRDTSNHFVEGIMFSKTEGVIMTGIMTDTGTNINKIGKWYKPWFYKHVESFMRRGASEECVPLRDYYHRHTKSLFWELEDIVPFGNNVFFRWMLGWAMPPKISFLKRTQTGIIKELYNKHHIVQDMIVPIHFFKEAVLLFDEEVNVYPLWLCPTILPSEPGLVHSFSDKFEIYIDVGIYGTPKSTHYDYVQTIKKMEEFVIKCRGYQMMYGGTYCSEEEVGKMFDLSLYNRMRDKLLCAKALPNLYGKINRKVRD